MKFTITETITRVIDIHAADEADARLRARNLHPAHWKWETHIICQPADRPMIVHHGYVNIYRSGVFHKCGKPAAFDRHAGDCYPTPEAAVAEIDPPSHYVATVPVQWTEPSRVLPNPGYNFAEIERRTIANTELAQPLAHTGD